MTQGAWEIRSGGGAIITAAIHDGHAVRDNVKTLLAISDAARLTEEDPCTGDWASISSTSIVGKRSRFEFDLNRPREKAIYLHPADSWGLRVWHSELPGELVEESRQLYDDFYSEVKRLIDALLTQHPHVLIYDLHTYNHRRKGPYAAHDDAELNPEVNVGTGTMDRMRWGKVVDQFLSELRGYNFLGRKLDVRENVKFFGGHFAQWMHQLFPEQVCVLSIEFKKFFMDEWTGEVDETQSKAIRSALAATIKNVLSEISNH